MDESRATTVEIMGREYRIRGVADDEYIQSVARFVDEKMREVSGGTSVASHDRLAILAALNIADELFEVRRNGFKDIEKRTDRLIELLDASLSPGD